MRCALTPLVLLVATALVVAAGTPSSAHPVRPAERSAPAAPVATTDIASEAIRPTSSPPPAATTESPPRATVATALLGLFAVLVVAGRYRRALALGLVLVACVLAFESGVHSVHHLGSPRGMSDCAVAVAVSHVQGTVDAPPVALARPVCVGPVSPIPGPVRRATPSWRAWRGRAPPSLALA